MFRRLAGRDCRYDGSGRPAPGPRSAHGLGDPLVDPAHARDAGLLPEYGHDLEQTRRRAASRQDRANRLRQIAEAHVVRVDPEPRCEDVVFYGQSPSGLYWRHLKDQFHVMADAKRAPDWLRDKVLMTDDPGEISAFYKRILELG